MARTADNLLGVVKEVCFSSGRLVKSIHRYAIASVLVLLPGVIWLGSDSVRRDSTGECSRCGSIGQSERREWYVWGIRGHKEATKWEVQPSLFIRDFPEFACKHAWNDVTSKNTRLWGGPLFQAAPRGAGGHMIGCGVGCPLVIELYHREPAFREKLKEALEDEVATRAQVVRWFEFRWLEFDEPFTPRPDETDAFAKLNGIADRFSAATPVFFNPLPIQEPPKIPLPEPF